MAETYAEVHRVLANRRRLMILWALEGRELSVSEIAHTIGASLQSTSQHLRLMREHDMLCSRREGHAVFYRLHPAGNLLVVPSPFLPPDQAGPARPSSNATTKEDPHDC